jgi:phosphoglycolate phosphatase-like HAD superfamily hydrolase
MCWGVASAGAALADDPLPSWHEGPTKAALVDFARRAADPADPAYVPPGERVAVFDNDGTLWPENPLPFQLAFALDELARQAPAHPEWRDDPLAAAALRGDVAAVQRAGAAGLLQIVGLTHTGTTAEEFAERVRRWLAEARHPRYRQPYARCAYQPMVEVLELLRAHGFKNFIVSGGGADFMRVWTEAAYGIPPEQVVGSTARTRYELRDGRPVLVKTLEHLFVDDKEGKPSAIHQFIGRRPIACFGNSDGDLAMLQYTTVGNPRPAFGLIVRHTDAQREYQYDARPASTGKLVEALREAPQRGWAVVDMQRDWRRIFAWE